MRLPLTVYCVTEISSEGYGYFSFFFSALEIWERRAQGISGLRQSREVLNCTNFLFFCTNNIFFHYLYRYQHKVNKVSTLSNAITYQPNKTSSPRTNTTISFTTSPTRPKQTISRNFLFPLTYVNRIFFFT